MKLWYFILVVSSLMCQKGVAQGLSDEERAWINIETFSGSNKKKIALLNDYIKKYPTGDNIERAKIWRHELQNEFQQEVIDDAISSREPQKLNYILKNFPNNKRSEEVRKLIQRLETERWKSLNIRDSTAMRQYIADFPNSEHSDEIFTRLLDLEKGSSTEIASVIVTQEELLAMNVRELQSFLRRYPQSTLVPECLRILDKRENHYYHVILAQVDNFPEFSKLYNKFKELFPESKRLSSLTTTFDTRSREYNINKDKPGFAAWNDLDKSNLEEVLNYGLKYPDSPFKKRITELSVQLEDKLYKKAVMRKSMAALLQYKKLLPNGKHIIEINRLINELKNNPKYEEYSSLASSKNIESLNKFINANKNNPLVDYALGVVNNVSDILYNLTNDEAGILVQLDNFDNPYLKVSDPDNVILIDSSELKSSGYFVVNFDDVVLNSEITIFDTNGRQRKIQFNNQLKVDFTQAGKILRIRIEGGVPPYVFDYKNSETKFIDQTYSNVMPGKDNFFLVDLDTIENLQGGNYDLRVKSNIGGQMVMLAGIVVDVHDFRLLYFILFTLLLIGLIVWVVRLYIQKSRPKTIFDEFE
ncbi:MAG TPA: hypothetical protein PL069_00635 [Saprospiraceae bacterium]|nr:hypothetical protein [Saprospiraceae bacterium]